MFFPYNHINFHDIEKKHYYEFDIIMKYFVDNYECSKVDYKIYHPNLTPNDACIGNYQKSHRDYMVSFSRTTFKI